MTDIIDMILIDTTMIEHGSHVGKPGFCAMEIYNLALRRKKSESVPDCAPRGVACLPIINDLAGWPSNAHRTAVLRPYLRRLVMLQRDPERDQLVAYAHADAAVRVFAPAALDAAGLRAEATRLRGLPRIDSASTAAGDARDALAAAGHAAAWGGESAMRAGWAIAWANEAAGWAYADAAMAAREAAETARICQSVFVDTLPPGTIAAALLDPILAIYEEF